MKALLALTLAMTAVVPAQAEIFRPGAGRGAPRGDHHSRGPVQDVHRGSHGGGYIYRHSPSVYVGYGPAYYPSYGYYGGYGADYPYYGSTGYYGSESAASSGFWLGALAGGIIGNNSGSFGHNGLRGAAWGAGAGWLLGSIADANRRPVAYQPVPVVVSQAAQIGQVAAQPAAQAPAPQQVTIINNYYNSSTPMSGANNLFGR
jgi:hypothetical protein